MLSPQAGTGRAAKYAADLHSSTFTLMLEGLFVASLAAPRLDVALVYGQELLRPKRQRAGDRPAFPPRRAQPERHPVAQSAGVAATQHARLG